MEQVDCRFLESIDNLKPLVKKRFDKEPSTSIAREITACLQQGRLFYEAAELSSLEIRPLLLFYGMVGFAKALAVSSRQSALSTLKPAHGLTDVSATNSRIADFRVRVESDGTFQEFNDVVAKLTRLCYYDAFDEPHVIYLPSAGREELVGIELSLKEILSRIPGLETLYHLTFMEGAQSSVLTLESGFPGDNYFRIDVSDPELFNDRESVKRIVCGIRTRFSFLQKWRFTMARRNQGRTVVSFRNTASLGDAEFSERHLKESGGYYHAFDLAGEQGKTFALEEAFCPVAGGQTGGPIRAVSPVGNLHISEFSFHYLGLFLLSTLVRYRPETWTSAISHSMVRNEATDDKALNLIERFLEINTETIPKLVVAVLNPTQDKWSRS